MTWQPIDSARKDRIIWLAMPGRMRLGYWRSGEEFEHHGSVGGGWRDFSKSEGGGPADLDFSPTHWQPVPHPPEPH